jgi:hypothetical protein
MRWFAPWLAAACAGKGTVVAGDGGDPADTDTDTDTDADTDADTDTDVPPDDTDPPLTVACLSDFAPCGGDVVGDWTVESFCVDGVDLEAPWVVPGTDCAGTEITIYPDYTGDLSFSADGTYTFRVETSALYDYAIPASCTYGYSCADFDAYSPDWTCTGDGSGGCVCSGVATDLAGVDEDAGTWVAAGNQLTFTGEEGPTDVDYCADRGVLRLYDAAAATGIGLVR